MTVDKKLYKQALDDVRDRYRDEIEKTVTKLVLIRDDPDTPARDVVNAAKALVVLLGVPRPAEQRITGPETKKQFNPSDWEPSPEENDRIAAILREN
jgi:hypothetical protein